MSAGATRVHLDTDLGSDTDDLCALALLLGWDGVEITGITTSTDPGGIRAGYTGYVLEMCDRTEIPVAAGAEGSLAGLFAPLAFPDYWPEPIGARPGAPGTALELLAASAERGATIVAVGPYTNLALLEAERPGLLASTRVVVMGGHVPTPRSGLPQWGVHDDFNVQQDRAAAAIVFERVRPTVVPLAVCLEVWLRAGHLQRLRASGPIGGLIADQAVAHARDNGRTELGKDHPGLPDDLLNFHYDPLACALAVGWPGVEVSDIEVAVELRDERLWMTGSDDAGTSLPVATAVDGRAFEDAWLDSVERAATRSPQ